MDLSIGEFQEVGQIVKQFASEDATVVVGTVIDPELSNTVRVTVVATGLGRPVATSVRSCRANASMRRSRPARCRSRASRRCRRCASCAVSRCRARDYAALDKPTVQRQRAVGDGLRPDTDTEDLLDIPAFLRRQAD